ncbi:MAG: cytochrome c [Rhodospirillales bacterium]|nr:cytochrome c [Rhodospirillales bacterium]MBO6785440.1 cytochrome c [Rhodospirillales bacterium]
MIDRRTIPALLLLAAMAPPAAADDAKVGQKIAEEHCSRCHVIGDYNKFGGIGSTPSFNAIKYLDDWRDRFQTFFLRRPHPAFVQVEGYPPPTDLEPYATPVILKPAAVTDILAFVETLKAR